MTMTSDELINKAQVIQFPTSTKAYRTYHFDGKEIHRIPLAEDSMYVGYNLNHNHFLPEYHRKYVLPLLSELLELDYKESDFILTDRKSKEGFDLSYLKPRRNYRFLLHGLEKNEKKDNIGFDGLMESDSSLTEYHKQYAYPHECSIVRNHTIANNRKLFISGDSQMIPDIPWLACFFKEVWYFDNRGNNSFKGLFEPVSFSDVLIELNANDLGKYTTTNMK